MIDMFRLDSLSAFCLKKHIGHLGRPDCGNDCRAVTFQHQMTNRGDISIELVFEKPRGSDRTIEYKISHRLPAPFIPQLGDRKILAESGFRSDVIQCGKKPIDVLTRRSSCGHLLHQGLVMPGDDDFFPFCGSFSQF
jgi:hypothetical protein